MAAYSFQDFSLAIVGPGGSFTIGGDGSANAEEGVSFAMTDDKDGLMIGADGTPMHSLHAGKSGTVTVRLQKTSPVNQMLSALYAAQTVSSALWGQNTMLGRDSVRGDVISCRQAAFKKLPDLGFGKDAGTNEWVFNAGYIDMLLGSGAPAL